MENYFIIGFNGALQSIGKFEDFDDAEQYLTKKNLFAFWVIPSVEELSSVIESVSLLEGLQGGFILNDEGRLEHITDDSACSFEEFDAILSEQGRDGDELFVYDDELFQNLQNSTILLINEFL